MDAMTKKESDASGRVDGEVPWAQATSDSKISITDLLNLVNPTNSEFIAMIADNLRLKYKLY